MRMRKRTKIVCIHEGEANSTDRIFANAFIRALKGGSGWLRDLRFCAYGGKTNLLDKFSVELKACGKQGANTTLVVLADVDDDCENPDALKHKYHVKAQENGISDDLFNRAIFIFPKDRIENWIEFFETGKIDENEEGPRVDTCVAKRSGRKLAELCKKGPCDAKHQIPPSLLWSCNNWRVLVERMK